MYKITVYIPSAELENVKQAMFDQGAGQLGDYDHCCWQVLGQGQFRPSENSNPSVGQKEKLNTVKEYLVEMICNDAVINAVIRALKQAHPYEEPAYSIVRLEAII